MQKEKKPYLGFLKLLPYFSPYKKDVFFAMMALVTTAFMILFFGKAIKYFIDFGFVQRSAFFINSSLSIFIIAILVMAAAGYYRSSLINSSCERVIAALRKKVYDHIIKVSSEFFEIKKVGDVVSRLTVDTALLYSIFTNNFSFFLRNLLLFLGGIIFLFLTSWQLTIFSIFLIFLAISPIFVMGKIVKRTSLALQEAVSSVGSHIEETLTGIKTIQSYSCEEKESQNFAEFVDKALGISLAKIKVRSLLIAFVIALAFGGIAFILWIGSGYVIAGKMTSGDLSSFIFYSIISATSLVGISQSAGQIQSALAALTRVFELLEIESPVQESKDAVEFTLQEKIDIDFKNVNFSYPSRKEKTILQNFNLKINFGEKIAICGPSGSGKTTVLQLLLRFYDVDLGGIFLNDYDIKKLTLLSLRQNFSYISQDSFIFSKSIFENIAYVNSAVTKARVQEIIDQNEFLHFINKMPNGIDSFVGEKGLKLSGGERQRIAMARAIVKDSPIFLLDEATSALDNENEFSVASGIAKISKNKTVITVAHKLSSIIHCDRIIFMKDGKITEEGSHHDLMAKNGFYKKMYEAEDLGVY